MQTLEDALAAIEEMKAAHEAEKTAILSKNTELIAREKQAKADADAAKSLADDAAEDAARKAGDLETLEKRLAEKHQKALDKVAADRDAATAQLNTLLIDSAIQKALVENSVPAHAHEALTALHKSKAALKDGVAMLGDVEIGEGLKTWFEGDAGKHFVTAPYNTGSGATGVKSVQGDWSKMPVTGEQWTAFHKIQADNPAHANSLADSWGAPNLRV